MSKKKKEPVAFFSYVRDDDKTDNGRLSQICERLSAEVKMLTGEEFPIFQDRMDIKWGQNWKQRLDDSLDSVTFLIPVITPSFFKSPFCCDELDKFQKHEKKLKRSDLILPLYYVTADEMDDVEKREENKYAKIIHAHQYFDWRELRNVPFADPRIGQALTEMAAQIKEALQRVSNGEKKTKHIRKRKSVKKNLEINNEVETSETIISNAERTSIPRTEIKTAIVDAMHRGDYSTISDAINGVEPGTKILVKPGTYNESLNINKPIEIIGDGSRDEIVIQVADADVVYFATSMGRISNLTIRQLGGDFYAIDISQGRLDVEDCDITSIGLAIIAIHDWADPRIRRNIIHDGSEGGVFIYENGQGTIEENDIFNNTGSGIEIREGGNPNIRKNRIRDGKTTGIHIYDNGKGTIEDNDIFNNGFSGIGVRDGGNPKIRKNRIRDGKQTGIFIYQKGLGTIEENQITNNTYHGITVREESNPQVRKNMINSNGFYGIRVLESGKGRFEENDLTNNAKGPWLVDQSSMNSVVKKNNVE